jgi:histidinol-phosphate/aromatic aminotransferase/cobyric acid decarboxylase-like protein/choline kinase
VKAIILAAGMGRRMQPLTNHLHKTLIEIRGKTLIGRIVENLLEHSIKDILVVTGYLAEQLEDNLRSYYPDAVFTFVRNMRYAETNNIYSLHLAFETVTEWTDTVLVECDLVFEKAVLNQLLNSPFKNVALVDKFRHGMDGTVVTLDHGVVTSIIPPHLQGADFDFSDKYKTLNIYRFDADFCNNIFRGLLRYYAESIDDMSYYELILGVLVYLQRETIHGEIVAYNSWAEIDDPNDLTAAEYVFDKAQRLEILEKLWGGYWNYDILDFCFLRNMYFPTTGMLAQMRNVLSELIVNYGSSSQVMNEKMSYLVGCDKNNLQVLNGASQAYPLLRSYYRNRNVLIPCPTFGEYRRMFPQAMEYEDCMGTDVTDLEMRASDKNLIVFVNPNNPTGTGIDTNWIWKFARDHPSKDILIDESFIDFSDYTSIVPLLERQPLENVIVLKSLSKYCGVPGIRLGYVYTLNRSFHGFITNELPIWNSNSLSEFFLEIAIKSKNELSWSLTQTKLDRESFQTQLKQISGIDLVHRSHGNFLLIRFVKSLAAFSSLGSDLLSEHSIYVKDVSGKFTDGRCYWRVAVRLPAENSFFCDTLSLMLKKNCLSQ